MDQQVKQINLPSVNNYTLIDNVFLGAVKSLSLNAYKLFALLASQIKRSNEHFNEYEIKADDLLNVFNISNKRYIYEVLKKATDELHEIEVIIDNDDERTRYPWLTKSSYLKNEGTAILRFHEDLKPFLLRLNARYSKIWLSQTFNFSSQTTTNVYLYLCENRYKENFTVMIPTLKEKIGIEKSAYSRYIDFKRRILAPTHEEIQKKTHLKYEFQPIKTGRRITHIQFDIHTIKMNTQKQNIPKLEKVSEITKLKEEYYQRKEIHMLHLLNESTEDDILDFRESLSPTDWEFSFENGKPRDLPFRYFLLKKEPFKTFDEWVEQKADNQIDAEFEDINDEIRPIKVRLKDLGWNGRYNELINEVSQEAIEAYFDNLELDVNRIDKSKLSKEQIHIYMDKILKTQAEPYYEILQSVLKIPPVKQ